MAAKPIIWIISPCYNEEDVLPYSLETFTRKIDELVERDLISRQSRVCFIDDGSRDNTWRLIEEASQADPRVIGIKQSRNRGHQNSLLCAMMEARGKVDAVVTIDCDGQDDVNAIDEMVLRFLDGDDVVYGVRSNRDSDTRMKRGSAQFFYRLMNAMGAETVYNHADYRLLSARALDGLAEYGEVNLYLRGIMPLVGLPHSTVEYTRDERVAGESHYPLRKMLHLAFDGITSFSIKPVRIVSMLGIIFSLVGLVGVIWAIASFFLGSTISGWSSTVCIICTIGGIQLVSVGIIGEYLGKVYLEVKRRPRYLVERRTWDSSAREYRG
ncbi:ribonuclease III [Denitrobacterium detoxificans]|jgi:glycosyltransferase involved in cell wall biosynthesis|uniref:Glycosyltransferase involved in cell wall bisynthesis n=1 Tax=Denitrobacterium detoxificans TaxID=79604 RepID=A0A172RWR6_9ACTN|nr:glycosyltransferase family 2 protein [Denitrobacterium detoxificans]ANE22084.1 ribonuclease III [Denitrobacterium detoxificans]MBE6466339.1 glycosyltransferase [Denitrobacterium detoxificans]SEO89269.1 Glycosyltransferase involved in cell wall bisynthesis [Denitrobacterium detoxificans]